MILIDSVLKNNETIICVKKWKYIEKERKSIRYITDDSDESDEEQIKLQHHDGVFFFFFKVNSSVGKAFLKEKIGHLSFKQDRKGLVYFWESSFQCFKKNNIFHCVK